MVSSAEAAPCSDDPWRRLPVRGAAARSGMRAAAFPCDGSRWTCRRRPCGSKRAAPFPDQHRPQHRRCCPRETTSLARRRHVEEACALCRTWRSSRPLRPASPGPAWLPRAKAPRSRPGSSGVRSLRSNANSASRFSASSGPLRRLIRTHADTHPAFAAAVERGQGMSLNDTRRHSQAADNRACTASHTTLATIGCVDPWTWSRSPITIESHSSPLERRYCARVCEHRGTADADRAGAAIPVLTDRPGRLRYGNPYSVQEPAPLRRASRRVTLLPW
jgi:hypothetical protein